MPRCQRSKPRSITFVFITNQQFSKVMQTPKSTESHRLSYKDFFGAKVFIAHATAKSNFCIMQSLATFTVRLAWPSLKLMAIRRVLITSRIVSDMAVEKRKARNIVNFISVPALAHRPCDARRAATWKSPWSTRFLPDCMFHRDTEFQNAEQICRP